MKSGIYLRQLINRINEKVDFIDATQKHTFNELYEGMLKDLQSAGRAGEFYTPRPVTNFIVEKIDPKLGETVLDPACGTGGFLTSTIAHMGSITTTEQLNTLQTTIFGWEKKPLPYLLAMTNLILHDIETPQIRHINSLNRPVTDYSAKDRVDVIVANPPFGGAEDDAVKQNFPAEFRTSETADLFLVLMMYLLKDKGRCGVVLPDGFMFGDGVKAAIKKECWMSSVCTPLSACRRFSSPMPALIRICCSSRRGFPAEASGSTGWIIRKESRALQRPGLCWTSISIRFVSGGLINSQLW